MKIITSFKRSEFDLTLRLDSLVELMKSWSTLQTLRVIDWLLFDAKLQGEITCRDYPTLPVCRMENRRVNLSATNGRRIYIHSQCGPCDN
jgi:hypothetical protein